MAIKRNQVNPPVLPKEAVRVDSLGDEVIVRALTLTERLQLMSEVSERAEASKDGAADDARQTAGSGVYVHVSRVLSMTVLADDNKPLFTREQWEEFGARNSEEALQLFMVVQRLSGLLVEEAKKN